MHHLLRLSYHLRGVGLVQMLSFKQKEFRKTAMVEALVKAAHAVVEGKNTDLILFIGIALVHAMHLVGERHVEEAIAVIKEAQRRGHE